MSRMKRNMIFLLTAALVLSLAACALAGSATGSGTQIRGNAGRNAQLISTPFEVPPGVKATIVNVACDGDGFWMESSNGISQSFSSAGEAIGVKLPAGTYRVYPNLKEGQFKQETARVSVTVSW